MSKYFIPVLFLSIFLFSILKKVRPYDTFCQGVKSAVPFAVNVFPYLATILILTELFQASGLADWTTLKLTPLFNLLGIPPELSKLVLVKPFSGSGSLALLSDIFTQYGVDSYISRCASVIYGSSETVFYVAAVYFAGAKTKKLATPILISLIASLASCVFACFICKIL